MSVIIPQEIFDRMYIIPDSTPEFVLLSRDKNNRYAIYESGDKISDVIAKILVLYDDGKDRDAFMKKVFAKVEAFKVIQK